MKRLKIFIICEFFLIFFALMLPPMLVAPTDNYTPQVDFSVFVILKIVFCSIALFFLSDFLKENFMPTEKFTFSVKIFFYNILFCAISLIAIFGLNLVFAKIAKTQDVTNTIKKTLDTKTILKQTLQIVFAATYEEILYRKYCINRLTIIFSFFSKKSLQQNLQEKSRFSYAILILAVVISSLFFALAHLYIGFLGVLFSFFSALVFSLLYTKTKNVIYPCLCHIIYNLVVFYLF